eukprot:399910-Prymnesium_polylepis.1
MAARRGMLLQASLRAVNTFRESCEPGLFAAAVRSSCDRCCASAAVSAALNSADGGAPQPPAASQ